MGSFFKSNKQYNQVSQPSYNKSTRPNLLNTDRQRPKYIDNAKLYNRNKHSVLYTTIRHAIRHNTPCLTTLSHDSV
jgi:hypothetical protein